MTSVKIDMTGRTYGRLTVMGQAADRVTPGGQRQAMWTCACSCGGSVVVRGYALRQGTTVSCGCWGGRERVDHTGRRYGHLLITGPAPDHIGVSGAASARFHARCDCGRTTVVYARNLTRRSGGPTCCPTCSHEEQVNQLVGRTFGRWTVLARADNPGIHGGAYWLCECSCPDRGRAVVRGTVLMRGQSASCGCLVRERMAARVKDFVNYASMHSRLKLHKGRASDHQCMDCGEAAAQWSYVGECEDEIMEEREKGGRVYYCLHDEHFVPRCLPDHMAYDRILRQRRQPAPVWRHVA